MIPVLFVTLAVLAAPLASPTPWHPHRLTPPRGCPAPAIGFYEYKPDQSYSFGSGTMVSAGELGDAGPQRFHFYRMYRGLPRAAALVEVDPDTHALHALAGSVRKVGMMWCVFSVREPIPARLLRPDQ